MMTKVITVIQRFRYLHNVFENESNIKMSFPEFMECIFSKLESEIRTNKSGLEHYFKIGEGDKKPISDQTIKFKYDYTR